MKRLGALLVLMAAAMSTPAWAQFEPACEQLSPSPFAGRKLFLNELTPGISWPAWAQLLGRQWTPQQIARRVPFDAAAVLRAVRALPDGPMPAPLPYFGSGYSQNYRTIADAADAAAYDNARKLYLSSRWADAIPLFDAISANRETPYRAAAAYSAARASLMLGDYDDGVRRIDAILSDPTLREFHKATYHLLGTVAYLTRASRMTAARSAEMVTVLTAPPTLVCQDLELQQIYRDAQDDFAHYASGWVANWERYSTDDDGNAALAAIDPVVELARALAFPSPYTYEFTWDIDPARNQRLSARISAADRARLAAHAHRKWQETKNPLWAYVVARQSNDLSDVALLDEAIDSLGPIADTAALQVASIAFRWYFSRHATRILLMHGEPEQALDLVERRLRDAPRYYQYGGFSLTGPYREDVSAIVNGGVRQFIAARDLEHARWWATETSAVLHYDVDPGLRPLLVRSFEELEPYWDKSDRAVRALVDVLPAQRMIEISRLRGLKQDQRRAFLGAGWVRLYLMGRWSEVKALLPEMRTAFPELATDIDNIQAAWLDSTKQHLVLRLLLRSPGLGPRAVWAANFERWTFSDHRRTAGNIFSIDPYNPSDGNWWCSMPNTTVKPDVEMWFFRANVGTDAGIDELIKWHPLLKDYDDAEWQALAKAENGPRMLSERALQWADNTNWLTRLFHLDRDLPETLHLAVRSTRYGCRREGGHGEYSRAAFDRLHTMYPESEWTRKTPYWFDRVQPWYY